MDEKNDIAHASIASNPDNYFHQVAILADLPPKSNMLSESASLMFKMAIRRIFEPDRLLYLPRTESLRAWLNNGLVKRE